MSESAIHSVPELVDVTWRPELRAVYLQWHSEYDDGTAVRDAIRTAVDFVKENDVKHWLADISESSEALSEADLNWVNGEEFRDLIGTSPLTKFVLMPPLPHTGQDTGWLSKWEENTLKAFGEEKSAKLSGDMNEIRAFFGVTYKGRMTWPKSSRTEPL